jgi:hypothetical protein
MGSSAMLLGSPLRMIKDIIKRGKRTRDPAPFSHPTSAETGISECARDGAPRFGGWL